MCCRSVFGDKRALSRPVKSGVDGAKWKYKGKSEEFGCLAALCYEIEGAWE